MCLVAKLFSPHWIRFYRAFLRFFEEYLYIMPFLALDFPAVRRPWKEVEVYIFSL